MSSAEQIAHSLEKGRRIGADKYIACCPAHNDSSPSLHITQKGELVLFKCFAGCAQTDVLRELQKRGLLRKKDECLSVRPSFSEEELLEMFLFLKIFENSENRPDLPPPTEENRRNASRIREILESYNFDMKRAQITMRKL